MDEMQLTGNEYFVIETVMEDLTVGKNNSDLKYLCTQYYKGKAVQLRAEEKKNENLQAFLDVYLCEEDGQKELVASNIPSQYRRYIWCLGEDGYLYLAGSEQYMKMDNTGAILLSGTVEGSIEDVCLTSAGEMVLCVRNTEQEGHRIVRVDGATGAVNEGGSIYLNEGLFCYITGINENVLLLSENGLFEINLRDGSRKEMISFSGTTYQLTDTSENKVQVSDFGIPEANRLDILRSETVEKLTWIDIAAIRTLIFVRVINVENALKESVVAFNKQNTEYYVVLDTPEEGEEPADYFQRTNVELMTGKGADILFGDSGIDINDLIEVGLAEDLKPYMEQYGVKEADFFPVAFDCFREDEKIYGANMYVRLRDQWMDAGFLGSTEAPTIQILLECLKNHREKAVFFSGWSDEAVLRYFLAATEDFWGMINWESNGCDFDTELFKNMLEMAKQYGDENAGDYPALSGPRRVNNLYRYDTLEELEKTGKVQVGLLFNDGAHISTNLNRVMVVNSKSANKEGAVAFLFYLLGEGGQAFLSAYEDHAFPVNRAAYQAMVQQEIEDGSVITYEDKDGRIHHRVKGGSLSEYNEIGDEAYRALYDVTEERGEEIMKALESAVAPLTKTNPLLDVICEEAMPYFAGSKTIEEIIPIIENRVRLYLDEHQ